MNYDQIILTITYRSLIWLTNTICSHNFVLENWYFSIKFRAATAILYVLRPENLVFHWLVRNGSHSYPPNALLKLHVCLSYKLSKQMGGIRLLPKKNVYFVTDIVVHKVSSEQISPLFFPGHLCLLIFLRFFLQKWTYLPLLSRVDEIRLARL